jgi:hypothetical protein
MERETPIDESEARINRIQATQPVNFAPVGDATNRSDKES